MNVWKQRVSRRALAGVVGAGAVVIASTASAAVARTIEFHISPQAMADALRAYGIQSGTSVVFDPAVVRKLQSPGVAGRLDEDHALGRLLYGSGLTAARVGSGYVIQRAGAAARKVQMAQSDNDARPVAAQVQTQPANSENDIVVTARRIEERLQDVPISITVFNQQQLTNRNIVNSADLGNFTPSLNANAGQFGSQNTKFAIRGFVQDTGTQPSVGVYFADVVAPRGASNNQPIGDGAGPGSFFDLQNVQVLKGPQGTLFGRNTTGGAILLVPKKPTDKFEGYVEGSLGNYNMKRIQAVINLPLWDTARLRIGVDHQSRDGYVINDSGVGPSRFSDINYTSVRASLVADLTPDIENYLIGTWTQSDTDGDAQKLVACLPDTGLTLAARLANAFGEMACGQLARQQGKGFYHIESPMLSPRVLLTQWQLIDTTTWRVSDGLTVKNIISYAQLKQLFGSPLFGARLDLHDTTAFANVYPAGTYIDFAQSNPIPGLGSANQSTFTEEFRLQGQTAGNRLTWQTGAYLEVSSPLSFSGAQTGGRLDCSDVDHFICANPLGAGAINYTPGKTNFHNFGLYAQGTYKLSDKFSVTGGVRYTWDKVDNISGLKSFVFPRSATQGLPIGSVCVDSTLSLPDCLQSIHQRSSAPTWLVDIDYKPSDDILLYAKYTRGYRAGGIIQQAPQGYTTFKAEKVDTYEAGLKTSFAGRFHGTFNVAGFYNDFRNQQLATSLLPDLTRCGNPDQPACPAPASGIVNAGKSRIYGAEVEASVTPFTGFTLDVGYAYLNTRLQQIVPVTNAGLYLITFSANPGDPLVLTPKNKVVVTGTYTLPLDNSIGRVSLGATFTHADRALANYTDRLATVTVAGQTVPTPAAVQAFGYVPATNLLNLNLNWEGIAGQPIDLELFATNVTNRQYYAFAGGLFQGLHFETATLAPPRMFGARLRYRFGS